METDDTVNFRLDRLAALPGTSARRQRRPPSSSSTFSRPSVLASMRPSNPSGSSTVSTWCPAGHERLEPQLSSFSTSRRAGRWTTGQKVGNWLKGLRRCPPTSTSESRLRIHSTKLSYSPTELQPLFQAQGVKSLVTCGLQSEFCVDTNGSSLR